MLKDGQWHLLRRWLSEGCTLREAARRCGIDEKTARRYRRSGMVPTPRAPRSWRTRADVFADVCPRCRRDSNTTHHCRRSRCFGNGCASIPSGIASATVARSNGA